MGAQKYLFRGFDSKRGCQLIALVPVVIAGMVVIALIAATVVVVGKAVGNETDRSGTD